MSSHLPAPELLRGTLDAMILRTLDRGPSHGYAIARAIERASRGDLLIEEGSLYPALHRLLKRGDVSAEWRITETGRRARYYALSAQGITHLADELRLWAKVSAAVSRVLAPGPDRTDGPAPGGLAEIYGAFTSAFTRATLADAGPGAPREVPA